CDRKCRLREKNAETFVDHDDPIVSSLARGVIRHHQDDDWFHRGATFNDMVYRSSMELSKLLNGDRSMRTNLVAHVVIEMLLDAYLHEQHPGDLDRYYAQIETVDPSQVQSAINLFATRETNQLTEYIERFRNDKFLFDYATDEGVLFRMNKVLRRVGLEELPEEILGWCESIRQSVHRQADELLYQYEKLT
ncbi:MAG: hypothetical protein AAF497_25525, partial [Planctomycetota bacterium]